MSTVNNDLKFIIWVRDDFNEFYSKVFFKNDLSVYDFQRELIIEIARASKYEPMPKNILTISKKGKVYNKFIKKLKAHIKQNEDLLLFHLL